jgi:2-oxoglutarate dehydrogenase E2 component (dihydrolipoamide succinyltransferase)
MTVDIKVPLLGESITEGTLSRWLKKDGEFVQADEPLLELETEKATSDIPAPASGKLQVNVPEGQIVAVGAVIGRINDSSREPARGTPDRAKASLTRATAAPAPGQRDTEKAISLSPAGRRLAEEHQIDPRQVAVGGRPGLVTKEDVVKHLQAQQSPRAPEQTKHDGGASGREDAAADRMTEVSTPQPSREERQHMTSIRQRIAERLVASQQSTATLTTFNEADLSEMMALRARYKERFQEKHGVGLGFMSFFVKAVVEALQARPIINASIDNGDIVYHHAYHIGVAVSTDRGLMVPVLRDADSLTFAQIEKHIAVLADKARAGKIGVSDLQGGTFTITNGGIFGSLLSTPILNPPQSAILGMHAIQQRAVVVNGQVVARPMMYLALSYDHRLIDGRDAVLFLVRVKECVEHPERLLLEV